MPRMSQEEIDELSNSFGEAWEDFFGEVMYYVPFDEEGSASDSIYGENKKKKYLFDQKVKFHGTYKEEPIEEAGELGGRRINSYAEITFVTKELRDNGGITEVDQRAVIQRISRDGKETIHNIIEKFGKVQLVDNWVFTKLKVVMYDA